MDTGGITGACNVLDLVLTSTLLRWNYDDPVCWKLEIERDQSATQYCNLVNRNQDTLYAFNLVNPSTRVYLVLKAIISKIIER